MRAFTDDAILAATIVAEAANQPFAGQVAVAEVVLERARRGYNSGGDKSIAGVIFYPEQFSCWNHTNPWRARILKVDWDEPAMQKARDAIDAARNGEGTVQRAVLYHTINPPPGAKKWPPYWASKPGVKLVATIGDHKFYTDGNGK